MLLTALRLTKGNISTYGTGYVNKVKRTDMTDQEKEIIEGAKEFCEEHGIPFEEMHESVVLNSIREADQAHHKEVEELKEENQKLKTETIFQSERDKGLERFNKKINAENFTLNKHVDKALWLLHEIRKHHHTQLKQVDDAARKTQKHRDSLHTKNKFLQERVKELEEGMERIKKCAHDHCNNFGSYNDFIYHTANDLLTPKA